jgi:glucuronate isomerase
MTPWIPSPGRLFGPDPAQHAAAADLYRHVEHQPLVCPHTHLDPALLAEPGATLGTPAELFVIGDHYVTRMLYSQGIGLEQLGIPTRDATPTETDHRRIWQRFAENFHLFHTTPTGVWLTAELTGVFGVEEKLTGESGQRIYDCLEEKLAAAEFTPRALFERFNVEVVCTTDGAGDDLAAHRRLREQGLAGRVRPTFRPDAVTNLAGHGWTSSIETLAAASGIDIVDYRSFVAALENRRAYFADLGAVATDGSVVSPYTERLAAGEAETIMTRALAGRADGADAARFTAHMLMEGARMSVEDGLVMQLHVGSLRDHDSRVAERFGPDQGGDIPVATEWTRNLRPLLDRYGSDPRLRLILFTLDESTYSRELAPLAGHYPALLLGAPWWFHDSANGMRRYLDRVTETAGVYNTAGFNDDTRAFPSIPARHDMWRRVTCDWLAGKVLGGILDEPDAAQLATEFASGLARRAYKLDGGPTCQPSDDS